jgi:hypothetical protein
MRLTKRLTFLSGLLFMIACAYGQDVHYNYYRGTGYKAYESVDVSSASPRTNAKSALHKLDPRMVFQRSPSRTRQSLTSRAVGTV